jgi:uncharacterized membrane protein
MRMAQLLFLIIIQIITNINHVRLNLWVRLRLGCLTPLSTIFQLYRYTELSRENHWSAARNWRTLSHHVVSSAPLSSILEMKIRNKIESLIWFIKFSIFPWLTIWPKLSKRFHVFHKLSTLNFLIYFAILNMS